MEEHCQEKLAAADKRNADIAAEAAAAAALAIQTAVNEQSLHVKALQTLQDEAQANYQVQAPLEQPRTSRPLSVLLWAHQEQEGTHQSIGACFCLLKFNALTRSKETCSNPSSLQRRPKRRSLKQ